MAEPTSAQQSAGESPRVRVAAPTRTREVVANLGMMALGLAFAAGLLLDHLPLTKHALAARVTQTLACNQQYQQLMASPVVRDVLGNDPVGCLQSE